MTPEEEALRGVFQLLDRLGIVTPEDAILSKLEWARRSGESERQLRDAAGVLELNPDLDRAYVDRWAAVLGIEDLWLRIVTTDNA